MNNRNGLRLVYVTSSEPPEPRAELEELLSKLDISEEKFNQWRQMSRVMRRLYPGAKDLTFDEISFLAQRQAESYEEFVSSNARIGRVELRVGEMKFWPPALNQPDGVTEYTFERRLPKDGLLQVWREADEEFDEVPLLFQDLAGVSHEGLVLTQRYGKDRSITLEVRKNQYDEYEIKLTTSAQAPMIEAIPVNQFRHLSPGLRRAIPACLYSIVIVVLLYGLMQGGENSVPRQQADINLPSEVVVQQQVTTTEGRRTPRSRDKKNKSYSAATASMTPQPRVIAVNKDFYIPPAATLNAPVAEQQVQQCRALKKELSEFEYKVDSRMLPLEPSPETRLIMNACNEVNATLEHQPGPTLEKLIERSRGHDSDE